MWYDVIWIRGQYGCIAQNTTPIELVWCSRWFDDTIGRWQCGNNLAALQDDIHSNAYYTCGHFEWAIIWSNQAHLSKRISTNDCCYGFRMNIPHLIQNGFGAVKRKNELITLYNIFSFAKMTCSISSGISISIR